VTDLDQRIASVLRERAEGEIDTRRLLSRSRAGGRRRQLRRRAVTGGALALVGVFGIVAVTGPELPGLPPWTTATPAAVAPVPPRADGVPGAAQRPDLVGTDPQVLHLGVDPTKGRYLDWGVTGEVESVRFDAGGGRAVDVSVARSAAVLGGADIDGTPVEVPPEATFDGSVQRVTARDGSNWYITWWRPATGLYARASMRGEEPFALTRAIAALRWNEAHRCGGPLRLTTLPAGARTDGCSADVSSFPGAMHVVMNLYRGTSDTMSIRLEYNAGITGMRSDGNRTVGGRPAYLYPQGRELELLGIPRAHLIATYGYPETGFTEGDATTLLAGAQVAKDPGDPETWD